MIEMTLLGTSSMVPTKERNVIGVYLEVKGKGILFDCGEGTQRQMNIAGINRNKIQYIFISHWHADHIAGLLGLIQTIQNNGVETIKLFGPTGTKKHFGHLMEASVFDSKISIEVKEFDCPKVTKIFKCDEFRIEAVNLKHSTPCLAFSLIEANQVKIKIEKLANEGVPEGPHLAILQEGKDMMYCGRSYSSAEYTSIKKGKKITYVVDTSFISSAIDIAKDSDLLLSEATYTEAQEDKADQHLHMTSKQAAQIASMSDSRELVICHFSQRYKTIDQLLNEAKEVFPNTRAGFDFMKIKIK